MTDLSDSRPAADTFGDLPVGPELARSLKAMRYHTPTPIQERSIPVLREGRDVLAQAQTGTGKTAGFGIPLIETIDAQARGIQAIVLVPTRELCIQVAEELTALGRHAGVRVTAVYGGVGLGRQIDLIRGGAQVVVGTPGRVEDLMQRGDLRLDRVRFAVLDEADRMLDVGFLPAIERILKATPRSRQTSLFSATIPEDIRGLAHRQMRDPVTVAVDPERPTVEAIEQHFERVAGGDKTAALQAHLDRPSCYLALVFRRTTYKVDRLARDLSRKGYKVAALHGRRTQGQRERTLADLKAGKLQAVIATDIAARGLDITGLTHVFNYDLPDTPETYVHRIGRTGRAGETGTAITLINDEDADGLRALERYLAGRKDGGKAPERTAAKPKPAPQRAANRTAPQPAGSAQGQGGNRRRRYRGPRPEQRRSA